MTAPLPPGWFADPGGSDSERFWDGHEWTTQIRPKAGSAEPFDSYKGSFSAGVQSRSDAPVRRTFPVLKAALIMLGVIGFLLGFAPYVSRQQTGSDTLNLPSADSIDFFLNLGFGSGVVGLSAMLAAALIAAFSLVPRQSPNDSVVAGLSFTGFAALLCLLIGIPDGLNAGVGLVLVLIASFLQAICALMIVLLSSGVVRFSSTTP